jgi:hypothetical protein
MRKITSNSEKFSKRLLQYSALSVAALGVADASGQIVYTDLDPDEVLNVGDSFIVDFTAAGSEFNFSNPAGLAGGNAAIVFPSAGGAFVGITAAGFQYPALLAEGDIIDGASGFTATGARGDLNYYGCAYSNSQWCNDVVDGYLGVRFTFSGNTHYGWVRLDTDVNGSNLMVIKDFAFESSPNTAIEAGDEGGLSTNDQAIAGFNHFYNSTSKQLTLSANEAFSNVSLYNLLGQEVITESLSSNREVVDLSTISNGVYIGTANVNGQVATFKIIKR